MNKRGFIFSYDAVVALSIIVVFIAFLTYYVNSFPYSSFQNYEVIRSTSTMLGTMISKGEINKAVEEYESGNTLQAKLYLSNSLKSFFKNKYHFKITIKLYSPSGQLTNSFYSYYPSASSLSKTKNTYSVSNIFFTGNEYGIAQLQTWA